MKLSAWQRKQLNNSFASYLLHSEGIDFERVARQIEATKANEAKGLETCWHCLAGQPFEYEICSECGTEEVPF